MTNKMNIELLIEKLVQMFPYLREERKAIIQMAIHTYQKTKEQTTKDFAQLVILNEYVQVLKDEK